MNLQKASIILDTINALYKRMEMKGGNVPSIERDLMLENIRELYEFFVTHQATSTAAASAPTSTPVFVQTPTPPPAPKPAPVREVPTYQHVPTPPPAPKPAPVREVPTYQHVPTPPPTPPTPARKVERLDDYKPPRIIEIPDSLKADTPIPPVPKVPTYQHVPTPPAPVIKAPEYVPPAPVVTPPPPPPAPEPSPVVKATESAPVAPEFDTLFEHKAARELSEKLSERPIADLTRAVGYNDKMLYTNELFGGELVGFNSAVSEINSMGSFAEARKHLAFLAEKHNWTMPNKTNSAKTFIKLVRRRFGA